mmetsp:Transcript_47745/g.126331  ORF Transcript_47745/g.126331 Transcript_47745/m.126331 type:complete len:628 (+) Transcript_47745:134-2017(+)
MFAAPREEAPWWYNQEEDDIDDPEAPRRNRALRAWGRALHKIAQLREHKGDHAAEGQPWQVVAHCLFIVLLYATICFSLPISQVADAKRGVDQFAEAVTFERSGGLTGSARMAEISREYDAILYGEAFIRDLLANDPSVLPQRYHNNSFFLEVNRLMNSIVVVQRRVYATDCSYPQIKSLYPQCFQTLEDNEVKSGAMSLRGGQVVPYSKKFGGFAVQLPLDQFTAMNQYHELMKNGFWDMATRQFTIRFAFHNSPGHYTANVDVDFSMTPYGEVVSNVHSAFLRLKPYAKEVHGERLIIAQLATTALGLALFLHYCYAIHMQPHFRWKLARLLHTWHILELANYALFALVIVLWWHYISDDSREATSFDSHEFQDIRQLSEQYFVIIFLMALALLLWTVRTIEFFAYVGDNQLRKISQVVQQVAESLAPFFLVVAVLFAGFVFTAHIIFGTHFKEFDGPVDTLYTLLVWFVALGSGQRAVLDVEPGGSFFMFFFIMIGMVLLFNMFIALVMAAHDRVMAKENAAPERIKPQSNAMADAICDWLGVGEFLVDHFNSPYWLNNVTISKIGMTGVLEALREQIEVERRALETAATAEREILVQEQNIRAHRLQSSLTMPFSRSRRTSEE